MDISKAMNNLKLTPASGTPLYLQISESIMNLIASNQLSPGTKLPPERELSGILGVSRTTAINAYRHLEMQGLVSTRVGSGTYVSPQTHSSAVIATIPWSQLFAPCIQSPMASILKELVSAPQSDDMISLAAGMPDPAFYPVDFFQQLWTKHSPNTAEFGHIPTEGYMPLRQSIASLSHTKNITATPEDIMVVSGSQQGLYLLTKALLEPGDYVITETPTYIGAIQTFQAAGARLLKVPVTNQLDLELIEDYLIRYRPKLFYILPTFQNPTGRTLSLAERKALLELAARYRLVIVEDDPYGSLHYDQQPPPSLKALDEYGGVIYLGTFSKIIFPGLRTGWLVAPKEVIHRLSLEKQFIDLHSNNVSQILLHQFLEAGILEKHLATVRSIYSARRDAMAKALTKYCSDTLRFSVPKGGFYFWCTLQFDHSTRMLLHEAAARGVTFVPGEAFYQNPAPTNRLRLCFVTHDSEQIVEGIRRLASVLKDGSKSDLNRSTDVPSIPII